MKKPVQKFFTKIDKKFQQKNIFGCGCKVDSAFHPSEVDIDHEIRGQS